jgi:hypothetical protein
MIIVDKLALGGRIELRGVDPKVRQQIELSTDDVRK